MTAPSVLRELLELFKRAEIPVQVRASIAEELGEARYLPAKEALLAGLAYPDSAMRCSCIKALANNWELEEVGPFLVDILLKDEFEFVRVNAACGLGAIRYKEALQALKQVILDDSYDMTLRETAYEAVLSILGRVDEDVLETGVDKPTPIDWDLVRNL